MNIHFIATERLLLASGKIGKFEFANSKIRQILESSQRQAARRHDESS